MTDYNGQYNETSFWDKMKRVVKKVGRDAVYRIMLLYHTLKKPEVPYRAKTVIIGALGYLISPLDAVPDILPGGLVDDAAVIAGALAAVSMYIDDRVRQRAQTFVDRLFGSSDDAPPVTYSSQDGGEQ